METQKRKTSSSTDRPPLLVLIDGDIIVYRCGFAAEHKVYKVYVKDEEYDEYSSYLASFTKKTDAKRWIEGNEDDLVIVESKDVEPLDHTLYTVKLTLHKILNNVKDRYGWDDERDDVFLFLTGKGNFREKIAVTREYKGNRDRTQRPFWYDSIRDYLIRRYNAIVVNDMEADDAISLYATHSKSRYIPVICSIDKDLLQIPGIHFNWVREEWYEIDDFTAYYNFCKRILTGDTSDNIQGIPRIGDVKADKILEDANTKFGLLKRVAETYKDKMGKYWKKLLKEHYLLVRLLSDKDYVQWLGLKRKNQQKNYNSTSLT